MVDPSIQNTLQHVGFQSAGVRICLSSDTPVVLERIPELLPPDAEPCDPSTAEESFGVVSDVDGTYVFTRGGHSVSTNVNLEFGLMLLQTQIRIYTGLNAAGRIFLHAGVVAVGDRAVILPGRSFAGKTTLVAAFLRAGTSYLSDEFAVLDEQGLVHPYPTSLSIREGDDIRRQLDATELGTAYAGPPLPVGAIVVTSYRPGASWAPSPMTPGRAALALLDNTLAAMQRTAEALPVLRRATDGPLLLAGDRGEADAVVEDVIARMQR
jgi:hypothetical protein